MKLIDIRESIPKHKTRKWGRRFNADTIVVHTTASNNQDPNKTARYHSTPGPGNHLSKKGAPGLAYHDFITKKGVVYHCNDYMNITWHTKGWNTRAVGVTLAFKGQDGVQPPDVMLKALEEHLTILCLYLKILPKKIKGHREGPNMIMRILSNGSVKYRKVCPGMGISLNRLRRSVTFRLQTRLASERLYYGKIDCDFGKKSKAALKAFDPIKVK